MSTVTVCLTSPQPGNDRLTEMLHKHGVAVWQMPLLHYAPPQDGYAELGAAIDDLATFSHVVFTSPHAVIVFQEQLAQCGGAAIGHLKFAVVGESTAKLCAEYGFPVHFIPATATSEALGALMALHAPKGSRILFPQGEGGRDEFANAMATTDVELIVVPAYCTIPTDVNVSVWKQRMMSEDWQALVVTSPKGLRQWMDLFGHAWCHDVMATRTLVVMGKTTRDAAEQLGFGKIKLPEHSTLESLAEFISSRLGVLPAAQR